MASGWITSRTEVFPTPFKKKWNIDKTMKRPSRDCASDEDEDFDDTFPVQPNKRMRLTGNSNPQNGQAQKSPCESASDEENESSDGGMPVMRRRLKKMGETTTAAAPVEESEEEACSESESEEDSDDESEDETITGTKEKCGRNDGGIDCRRMTDVDCYRECRIATARATECIVSALGGSDPEDIKYINDHIQRGRCSFLRCFNPPQSILERNPDLKEYQVAAVHWLLTLHENGLNGLVADEMGLGKTAECICFLNELYCSGKLTRASVVACPVTLLDNWSNELRRWAPTLNFLKYHGTQCERRWLMRKFDLGVDAETPVTSPEEDGSEDDEGIMGDDDLGVDDEEDALLDEEEMDEGTASSAADDEVSETSPICAPGVKSSSGQRQRYQFIITTHQTLANKWDRGLFFRKRKFGFLVVDEAHTLKNASSRLYKQLDRAIPSTSQRLLLTGSPIQNQLSELRNLYMFLDPYRGRSPFDLQKSEEFFVKTWNEQLKKAKEKDSKGGSSHTAPTTATTTQDPPPPKSSSATAVDQPAEQQSSTAEGQGLPASDDTTTTASTTPNNGTDEPSSGDTTQKDVSTTPSSSGAPTSGDSQQQSPPASPTSAGEQTPATASVISSPGISDDVPMAPPPSSEPESSSAVLGVVPNMLSSFDMDLPVSETGDTMRQFISHEFQIAMNARSDNRAESSEVTAKGRQTNGSVVFFQQLLCPLVLRRLKREVIENFPEKVNLIEYCEMSTRQLEQYEEELRNAKPLFTDALTSVVKRGNKGNKTLETASVVDFKRAVGGGATSNFVKSLVSRLRRICNHPLLFQGYFSRSQRKSLAKYYWKNVPGFKDKAMDRVLASIDEWSDFEVHQEVQRLEDPQRLEEYIIPKDEFLRSAKIVRMLSLVDEIVARNEKALIFSQFTTFLDIIQETFALFRPHLHTLRLDGSTAIADRNTIVSQFQNVESDFKVFLLSTKAGGVGLNLTEASTVILMDQDWNPHNDRQAEDRVHRLGQKKRSVTVYRLCCRNTVEESILRCCKRKLELDEAFGGSAESLPIEMFADILRGVNNTAAKKEKAKAAEDAKAALELAAKEESKQDGSSSSSTANAADPSPSTSPASEESRKRKTRSSGSTSKKGTSSPTKSSTTSAASKTSGSKRVKRSNPSDDKKKDSMASSRENSSKSKASEKRNLKSDQSVGSSEGTEQTADSHTGKDNDTKSASNHVDDRKKGKKKGAVNSNPSAAKAVVNAEMLLPGCESD